MNSKKVEEQTLALRRNEKKSKVSASRRMGAELEKERCSTKNDTTNENDEEKVAISARPAKKLNIVTNDTHQNFTELRVQGVSGSAETNISNV